MKEIAEVIEIIGSTGVPVLVTILIIYGVFKFVPEALAIWREERKDQKQYYADRQKQYDEQMHVLIRVAEESGAIVEHNSEAIKHNTDIHRLTLESHSQMIKSVQALAEELKARPCIKGE